MRIVADVTEIPEVRRLLGEPHVLGLLLVGSSSRSYADSLSDLDIEVIVDDETFDKMPMGERFLPGAPGEVELCFVPRREFASKRVSPAAIDHWPYEDCVVVGDRTGWISAELQHITAMPLDVQEARIKLHYWEFLFCAQRLEALLARGHELNVRVVAGLAAMTASATLFVLEGRWPPPAHWLSQNLSSLEDIPVAFVASATHLCRQPSSATARRLIQIVDLRLLEAGYLYPHSKNMLTEEIASPGMRAARENFRTL